MRRKLKQYCLAVSFILALPLLALAAYTYTPFDYVGKLFGNTSGTATITEAFGINNAGKIVGGFCADADTGATIAGGCSAPGNAPSHGYVRFMDDGKIIFKRINYPNSFETEATGINNWGMIVGLYDAKAPNPPNADLGVGFYCRFSESSGCKDFHTVKYPGSTSTDLQAVNDYGDIVGLYSLIAIPPFTDYGFLLSEGRFCSIDIGTAVTGAVDTNSLGINEQESVVGSYDDAVAGVIKAFLLTDVDVPKYKNKKPVGCTWATHAEFSFPDLLAANPPVLQTEAAGINEHGLIVGNYLDNLNISHAFQVQSKPDGTIDTTTFATIDFIPAQAGDNAASSLNDKGVIVGNYEDTTSNPPAVKERAWIAK
jgi:uncharacterized membrane protein